MTINKLSRIILLIMSLALTGALFFSCHSNPRIVLQLETFQTEGGWGYQIKKNDKVYIYQDCIPVVPGHHVFVSQDQAETIGKLVLQKLKNKKSPAVNIAELDSLKILYPASDE